MPVDEKKEEKKNWGDMDFSGLDEEDDLPAVPTRHETEVDVNGVKTVTTYRTDEEGKKYKATRVVKVSKKTIKVHKAVLERRKWAKFGQAELVQLNNPGYHGPGYADGFTTMDASDQILVMTPKTRVAEENNEAAQRAFEKMNVGTFEAWRPKTRGAPSCSRGDASRGQVAAGPRGPPRVREGETGRPALRARDAQSVPRLSPLPYATQCRRRCCVCG